MNPEKAIIQIIRESHPDVQAIYIFGSYDTQQYWADSDIDIALLLPPPRAESRGLLELNACREVISDFVRRRIDLINLRQASTVFQKEIIASGRVIYLSDQCAVDEFEMLVISYYQKLNQERRELLDDFARTGRAYDV